MLLCGDSPSTHHPLPHHHWGLLLGQPCWKEEAPPLPTYPVKGIPLPRERFQSPDGVCLSTVETRNSHILGRNSETGFCSLAPAASQFLEILIGSGGRDCASRSWKASKRSIYNAKFSY